MNEELKFIILIVVAIVFIVMRGVYDYCNIKNELWWRRVKKAFKVKNETFQRRQILSFKQGAIELRQKENGNWILTNNADSNSSLRNQLEFKSKEEVEEIVEFLHECFEPKKTTS